MAAEPPRIHYLFFFPFDFAFTFFLAAIDITAPTFQSWVYNALLPFATNRGSWDFLQLEYGLRCF